jgi:hypothetical protein
MLTFVVLAAGACGSDVPTKDDFTSSIGRITGGKVDTGLASCVYDRLSKDDPDLLKRAIETPDLTKAEDQKMTDLLAQCVLDRHDKSSSVTTTTTGE